jgi:hypothetical protein
MDKIPGFKDSQSLKSEFEWMCDEGDTFRICSVFASLVNYIVYEIIPNNSNVTSEEIDIYKNLEALRLRFCDHLIDTPEGEFDAALCTCFLESFLNYAGNNIALYDRFIPYLGDKCKGFCKYWDHFTGVRSPGLWSDEDWENLPPFLNQ